MKNQLAIDYTESVKHIASLVQQGIDAWTTAGELLVSLYDADPDNRAKIKEEFRSLPQGVLSTLEKIGRKRVVAHVFAASGVGFRKLQNMPYDIQMKHLKEPVEVVVERAGSLDILKVKVADLTKSQAEQVFAAKEIRDPAAQRALLADAGHRAKVEVAGPPDQPWTILKNRLVVHKQCEFTRTQLNHILAQLS